MGARQDELNGSRTRSLRIGINLMAWTGAIGPDVLALFPKLAALGYTGVEIPLLAPRKTDVATIRAALRESGLACTVSSALPSGASLLRADEQSRGVSFLRQCLTSAAAIGAEVVCGPLYAPVGELTGRSRTAEEWDNAVRALCEVGLIAEDVGVVLALEPLNRFETSFLNTARDARALVEEIGCPAVGILLDTFHMNVEEKDLSAAIRDAGAHLKHFHCSENDRGVVGSGHIPWGAVLEALRVANYRGWLVCETFNGLIPEIAAATAIWRPLFPDPMHYAEESLRFLLTA